MNDLVPVQVKAADLKPCQHCGESNFAPLADGLIVRVKSKTPDGAFMVSDSDLFIGWHCTNCGRIEGLYVGQALKIVAEEQKAQADADLASKTSEVLDLQQREQALAAELESLKEQRENAEAAQALAADTATAKQALIDKLAEE